MSCHGMTESLNRQLLFPVLVMTACLVACDEEDRTVKLTCNHAESDTIPIRFTMPESETAHVFRLKAHDLSPGAILRLIPDGSPGQSGSSRVIYILNPPATSYLPNKSQWFTGSIAGRYFTVEADPDVEKSVVGWASMVTRDTYIFYEAATRSVLRDAIAALNADSGAVETIRQGPPTSRFLVVSGVWSGGQPYPLLNISGRDVAVNTLEWGAFYLHVQYACSPLTATPHALISYLPVKYQETTGMVILDEERIDLDKYTFTEVAHP